MIEDLLKCNKIKITQARLDILSIISQNDINIKELIYQVKDINPSTIYRTLDILLDKNIITKYLNEDNKIYYSLNKHTHYLCCIKCHKKIKLDNCPFDNTNRLNDFIILEHSLAIKGLCKNCQNL